MSWACATSLKLHDQLVILVYRASFYGAPITAFLDDPSFRARFVAGHVLNFRLYILREEPGSFQPLVELYPDTGEPARIVSKDFRYGTLSGALAALRRATERLGDGTYRVAGKQLSCKIRAITALETIDPERLIEGASTCKFCQAGSASMRRRSDGASRPVVQTCKLLASIEDDAALDLTMTQMQEDGGECHEWKCTFDTQPRCRFYAPARPLVQGKPATRPLRPTSTR